MTGVPESCEEGFWVQSDGGRRVWAGQVHPGMKPVTLFFHPDIFSHPQHNFESKINDRYKIQTQVNSMFLTDIYNHDGEKEEEADQTLQVA